MLNKHTVKAIQSRLDGLKLQLEAEPERMRKVIRLEIGGGAYDFHFDHAELEPFVIYYSRWTGNPFTIGVIRDWKFIPDTEPERRKMDRASYAKAHMLAKALVRLHTGRAPYTDGDTERVKAMYDWFEKTGRKDIIAEAERLRDETLSLKGLK